MISSGAISAIGIIELVKPRLAPENGVEQASARHGVRQPGQSV